MGQDDNESSRGMKWGEFLEVLARLAHAKYGNSHSGNTGARSKKNQPLILDKLFVELALLFRILLPDVHFPPEEKQVYLYI